MNRNEVKMIPWNRIEHLLLFYKYLTGQTESEFIFDGELICERVQFKWLFQSLLNSYHGQRVIHRKVISFYNNNNNLMIKIHSFYL